jgi:uncharacterized protein YcsI (UPF0317 family)
MSAADRHLKVNDNTLTKEEQNDFLRRLLPACQPQEGSPANTFTKSELNDLQRAVGKIKIAPHRSSNQKANKNKVDIRDVEHAFHPPVSEEQQHAQQATADVSSACPQGGDENDEAIVSTSSPSKESLDWHGAPRLHEGYSLSQAFREEVRRGNFTTPTNGVCPGFLQCNLVVLPQGPVAFDFLLFCQRNPKACPLIEVCDVGSPHPHGVAPGADLRTDVPKYAIYRNGKLDMEVTDATDYWPQDSVAFLIGCSFSYDGALMNAGIPLKSAEQGKNVPMYKTSLKCRSAGSLSGNMVVSMKPIPAMKVSKHVSHTLSSRKPNALFSIVDGLLVFGKKSFITNKSFRFPRSFYRCSDIVIRLKSHRNTRMLMVDQLPWDRPRPSEFMTSKSPSGGSRWISTIARCLFSMHAA